MSRAELPVARHDEAWAEAARRCRLSPEAQAMARSMGLNPGKLVKNVPSRSEPWKAPVEGWVRQMWARRHGGR